MALVLVTIEDCCLEAMSERSTNEKNQEERFLVFLEGSSVGSGSGRRSQNPEGVDHWKREGNKSKLEYDDSVADRFVRVNFDQNQLLNETLDTDGLVVF